MTSGRPSHSFQASKVILNAPRFLNSSPRILLSAFGIHSGGGLVLLRALLLALDGKLKAVSLDERFVNSAGVALPRAMIESVPRNFLARFASLHKLLRVTNSTDVLLCFNSLPPLRKSQGRVVVYVHAPHFVGAHRGIRYTTSVALRIAVERLWFRFGIKNSDEIWVQTHSMANALKTLYPHAVVQIVPLIDDEIGNHLHIRKKEKITTVSDDSQFVFFYPADGVGHKNHVNLIEAWVQLAQEGKRPKLLLTLDENEWRAVTYKVQARSSILANIENLGRLSREAVLVQLRHCSALIFPSKAETFGLPMVEARALGIPIVASEKDFVRDVCSPAQTFDPDSPRSISMAVDRFMGGDSSNFNEYYSASQFIDKILS